MDGEVLYRKYFELGDAASFVRLQRFAEFKGMVDSKGNIPTLMGIWKSMWRWASLLENKETAWSIYHQYDPSMSREDWDRMMAEKIKKAWQFPTPSRYNKFMKENGWM